MIPVDFQIESSGKGTCPVVFTEDRKQVLSGSDEGVIFGDGEQTMAKKSANSFESNRKKHQLWGSTLVLR